MLNPSSLTYARINAVAEQKKNFAANAEDALLTMMTVVSNLSKEEQTPETVKTVADSMQETYYNKFKNKDVIYDASIAPEGTEEQYIVKDDSMFITVANGLPEDLTYVDIAGVRRKLGEVCKISVGMNAFVHTPMWKIVDGVLKIATPWMYAGADPETGIVSVVAGGITYPVQVMEPVDASKRLKIVSADVGKKEGCVGEISFEGDTIDIVLGHHGQAGGVVLAAGDTQIVDTAQQIFIIQETGNASIVTPEKLNGKVVSYMFYPFPYENRPVEEEESGAHRTNTRHLVIPGYGAITLTINATQIAGPTL